MNGIPSGSSAPDPDHRRNTPDLPATEQMNSVEPHAASEDGMNNSQDKIATECQGATNSNTNELAAYLAYEQFQREYEARYARYEQASVPCSRRKSKLTATAIVFLVGALVGIGTASWTGLKSPPHVADAIMDASDRPLSSVSHAGSRQIRIESEEQGMRGIHRSELPYDGASAMSRDVPKSFPTASSSFNSSTGITDIKSLSVGAGANNSNDATVDREWAKPDDFASNFNPLPKNIKQIENEPVRRHADGTFQNKATPKKHSSTSHAQSSTMLRIQSLRGKLAQCERVTNIFVREQCRWRLCSDSWGKNGCPSYSRPTGNTVN